MIIIGVDPGVNGGFAIHKEGVVTVQKMPATHGDIRDFLQQYLEGDEVVLYMEKITGFVAGSSIRSTASFKLGANFGYIRGITDAYRWRRMEVAAQTWQKPLGISRQGATDTVWKNRLKEIAQQRYPHLKVIHAVADALLIMGYGLKLEAGEEKGS